MAHMIHDVKTVYLDEIDTAKLVAINNAIPEDCAYGLDGYVVAVVEAIIWGLVSCGPNAAMTYDSIKSYIVEETVRESVIAPMLFDIYMCWAQHAYYEMSLTESLEHFEVDQDSEILKGRFVVRFSGR